MALLNSFPTQSEIRSNLGENLTNVLFHYTNPECKKLLGISPFLKGPSELFCSFSHGRLKNLNVLSTLEKIENSKHCTHEGILAIGEVILEKFKAKMKDDINKLFEYEFSKKCLLLEANKRKEINQYINDTAVKWNECMVILKNQYEIKLEEEIKIASQKWEAYLNNIVVQERMELMEQMLNKFRQDATYLILSLHDEFEEKHCNQRKNLIAEFNEIMRKQYERNESMYEVLQKENDMLLSIQNNKFHTQNIADIIYVSCMKNFRHDFQKNHICKRYEDQISVLKKIIEIIKNTNKKIKKELSNNLEENVSLEKQLDKIKKEFQEFINFVFQAAPDEANYLLNFKTTIV